MHGLCVHIGNNDVLYASGHNVLCYSRLETVATALIVHFSRADDC